MLYKHELLEAFWVNECEQISQGEKVPISVLSVLFTGERTEPPISPSPVSRLWHGHTNRLARCHGSSVIMSTSVTPGSWWSRGSISTSMYLSEVGQVCAWHVLCGDGVFPPSTSISGPTLHSVLLEVGLTFI